jgi:hypothetical protein
MRTPAPILLLASLLAIAAVPLLAADAEVAADEAIDSETATADAAPVTNDDSAAEDATPGTLAADDTFIPTVEISEDLSVSFPADI